ncbi:MAG: cyclic nucleotide-binding/CBS domain-containing protein, partial [Candidatus Aenigmatarchaeota archaeon]
KVKEVMIEDVATIEQVKNTKEAANLMKREDVGCLIVLDDNNVSGILTSTDLVKNIVAKDLKPSNVKVSEIMTKNVKIVSPEENLLETTKILLKQKIKRLPVVENKELVGIVSYKDILRVTPELNDFLLEKAHEEELKEKYFNEEYEERENNICEECGNYSENLHMTNGKLLCEECRDETGIV